MTRIFEFFLLIILSELILTFCINRLALQKVFKDENTFLIPENRAMTFPADIWVLNLFVRGELEWRYYSDCCAVSGSLWCKQVSSKLKRRFKNVSLGRSKLYRIISRVFSQFRFSSLFKHFPGTHLADSFCFPTCA